LVDLAFRFLFDIFTELNNILQIRKPTVFVRVTTAATSTGQATGDQPQKEISQNIHPKPKISFFSFSKKKKSSSRHLVSTHTRAASIQIPCQLSKALRPCQEASRNKNGHTQRTGFAKRSSRKFDNDEQE